MTAVLSQPLNSECAAVRLRWIIDTGKHAPVGPERQSSQPGLSGSHGMRGMLVRLPKLIVASAIT